MNKTIGDKEYWLHDPESRVTYLLDLAEAGEVDLALRLFWEWMIKSREHPRRPKLIDRKAFNRFVKEFGSR